jgi:hypothetical protein
MTITYRAVKGANLTPTEVDDNFHDLDDRVTEMEEDPPVGVGVSNITADGFVFYVHLTDSTILGPFEMPKVRWNFRGEWTPSTAYYEADVVTRGREGFYAVMFNHVSDTSFDEDAMNDSDEMVYDQILGPFNQAAPVDTITDAEFSPVLNDMNTYFRMLLSCEVTIPSNASIPFDIGTEIHFRQCTLAQPVNFIPEEVGVTINYRDGYDSVTDGKGAVVTFKKIGTDEWDAFGAFALEGST